MAAQEETDAFYEAAEVGDLARLQSMLDAGVPIDGRHKWGKTALWAAVQRGQAEAFFFLRDRGANPNVRHPTYTYARTPLSDVVSPLGERLPERERIFRALLDSDLGKDLSALQDARLAFCCSGTPAMVRGLIEAGADFRQKPQDGSSWLITALKDNDHRDEVIPLLVAAGADVTIRRKKTKYDDADDQKLIGKTVLEIAELLGHREVAAVLRAAGGDKVREVVKVKATNSTISRSWDRIESWLKANAPKWKPLRPGATEAQIGRVEFNLGFKLPADLKAFYRRHNGTDDRGFFPDHAGDDVSWYLLRTSALIDEADTMRQLLADGDFDGDRPKADRGVRPEPWHTKWVPIAGNGAGDSWCIDLAPATGGTRGQMIYVSHEMAPRTLLAKSLRVWLSAFADALEAGMFRYDKDEGGLVPQ